MNKHPKWPVATGADDTNCHNHKSILATITTHSPAMIKRQEGASANGGGARSHPNTSCMHTVGLGGSCDVRDLLRPDWGDPKEGQGHVILITSEGKSAAGSGEKAKMGWFLRYWTLLISQDRKCSRHDAARLGSLETDYRRAVKGHVKKVLLVNGRCGRHTIGGRFVSRALTGRANHKVSCGTTL
jgi:hypothetical protein